LGRSRINAVLERTPTVVQELRQTGEQVPELSGSMNKK